MPGHEMLDFNLRGQMRQMDDLTKRIQKGKITWKELQNNIRGSNKLLEYQNALQRASLSSMRAMGNGMYGTQLAIPALTKTNDLVRQQAVNMATNAAAAKAWGRSMMDTGKNMAFMGRQALLSVTAQMALLAGGRPFPFVGKVGYFAAPTADSTLIAVGISFASNSLDDSAASNIEEKKKDTPSN